MTYDLAIYQIFTTNVQRLMLVWENLIQHNIHCQSKKIFGVLPSKAMLRYLYTMAFGLWSELSAWQETSWPFLSWVCQDSLRLFVLLLSFVLLVARFLGAGFLGVMLLDLPMVLVHVFLFDRFRGRSPRNC